MSDIQMTAEPGPAPAPIPQAAPEEVVAPPEPLKSHVDKAPAPVEKPVSTRDALKAAREKVEASDKTPEKPIAEAKPKVEAKPAPAVDKPRGEHGHFVRDPAKTDAENAAAEQESKAAPKVESKPPAPGQPDHRVAPSRYSADAKAEWDATPDPSRRTKNCCP
jgi:hypothetical protein